VVLPAHIGADRIAHLILHPKARDLIGGKSKSSTQFEHHLSELGLDMEEIQIGTGSRWLHRSVSEVEAEAAGRLLAVAILRKDGAADLNPGPKAILMIGDALVVMKRVARA